MTPIPPSVRERVEDVVRDSWPVLLALGLIVFLVLVLFLIMGLHISLLDLVLGGLMLVASPLYWYVRREEHTGAAKWLAFFLASTIVAFMWGHFPASHKDIVLVVAGFLMALLVFPRYVSWVITGIRPGKKWQPVELQNLRIAGFLLIPIVTLFVWFFV